MKRNVEFLEIIEWIYFIQAEQLKRLRSRQSTPHGVTKAEPFIDHYNPPIEPVTAP